MLTGSSRTADSGRGEEMETDNNTNAIAIAPAEQPMDETREVLPNSTPGTSLDAEHSSEKVPPRWESRMPTGSPSPSR